MAANENFAESLIGSIIILYGALSSRGLIKPCFITTRFMPVFVILNLLSRLSDSLSINDDDGANYLQLNFTGNILPHANYMITIKKYTIYFLSFYYHYYSLSLYANIVKMLNEY